MILSGIVKSYGIINESLKYDMEGLQDYKQNKKQKTLVVAVSQNSNSIVEIHV